MAKSTIRVARSRKEEEFHQIFDLENETVVEDYSCAFQAERILYHGRMYITKNFVCFHSQIFRRTIKVVGFREIVEMNKRNTAIVFPNAIELATKARKYLFASFVYRDRAYDLLNELWRHAKEKEKRRKDARERKKRKALERQQMALRAAANELEDEGDDEERSDDDSSWTEESFTDEESLSELEGEFQDDDDDDDNDDDDDVEGDVIDDEYTSEDEEDLPDDQVLPIGDDDEQHLERDEYQDTSAIVPSQAHSTSTIAPVADIDNLGNVLDATPEKAALQRSESAPTMIDSDGTAAKAFDRESATKKTPLNAMVEEGEDEEGGKKEHDYSSTAPTTPQEVGDASSNTSSGGALGGQADHGDDGHHHRSTTTSTAAAKDAKLHGGVDESKVGVDHDGGGMGQGGRASRSASYTKMENESVYKSIHSKTKGVVDHLSSTTTTAAPSQAVDATSSPDQHQQSRRRMNHRSTPLAVSDRRTRRASTHGEGLSSNMHEDDGMVPAMPSSTAAVLGTTDGELEHATNVAAAQLDEGGPTSSDHPVVSDVGAGQPLPPTTSLTSSSAERPIVPPKPPRAQSATVLKKRHDAASASTKNGKSSIATSDGPLGVLSKTTPGGKKKRRPRRSTSKSGETSTTTTTTKMRKTNAHREAGGAGVAGSGDDTLVASVPTIPEEFLVHRGPLSALPNLPEASSRVELWRGTLPCSVGRFVRTFLVDESTFFKELDAQLGRTEWTMQPWEHSESHSTRESRFRMPVSAPIGPNSTVVEQTWCLHVVGGERRDGEQVTMTTSSRSLDVPKGDCFVTNISWNINDVAPDDGGEEEVVEVVVHAEVKFVKSVWGIKGLIERGAIDGSREYFPKFMERAKAHLEEEKAAEAAAAAATATPSNKPRRKTRRVRRVKRSEKRKRAQNAGKASSKARGGGDAPTIPPRSDVKGANRAGGGTATIPASASTTGSHRAGVHSASLANGASSSSSSSRSSSLVSRAMASIKMVQGVWEMLPFSVTHLMVFMLILLVSPALLHFSWRVSHLEGALRETRDANAGLETRVMFLQTLVAVLSENVTGAKGPTLVRQWEEWKENERFDRMLRRWQDELDGMQASVAETQSTLEKLDAMWSQHQRHEGGRRGDAAQSTSLAGDFISQEYLSMLSEETVQRHAAQGGAGPPPMPTSSTRGGWWATSLLTLGNVFWMLCFSAAVGALALSIISEYV